MLYEVITKFPLLEVDETIDSVIFKGPSGDITLGDFKLSAGIYSYINISLTEDSIVFQFEINSSYIRSFNFSFELDEFPASMELLSDLIQEKTQVWLQNNLLVDSSYVV